MSREKEKRRDYTRDFSTVPNHGLIVSPDFLRRKKENRISGAVEDNHCKTLLPLKIRSNRDLAQSIAHNRHRYPKALFPFHSSSNIKRRTRGVSAVI